MKKIIIFMLGILFCLPLVMGAKLCTDSTLGNIEASDFLNVSAGSYASLDTFASDQKFSGITTITPRLNFTATNLTTTVTIGSGLTSTLTYKNLLNTGLVRVENTSNISAVLGAGNYTVNYTSGEITWALSADAIPGWNQTTATVYYNRTFVKNTDNLVTPLTTILTADLGALYLINPTSGFDFGTQVSWTTVLTKLDRNDWAVEWTYTTGDCSSQNSCMGARLTIYAGFALLALFAIIIAAFGIISIFNGGDMAMASFGAIAVGVIGLAIVLIVGYFIIGNLGVLVCS